MRYKGKPYVDQPMREIPQNVVSNRVALEKI